MGRLSDGVSIDPFQGGKMLIPSFLLQLNTQAASVAASAAATAAAAAAAVEEPSCSPAEFLFFYLNQDLLTCMFLPAGFSYFFCSPIVFVTPPSPYTLIWKF